MLNSQSHAIISNNKKITSNISYTMNSSSNRNLGKGNFMNSNGSSANGVKRVQSSGTTRKNPLQNTLQINPQPYNYNGNNRNYPVSATTNNSNKNYDQFNNTT